jgi:(1->4)-alpha-D-glucan 1-alpha-D-glucosylmutase
LLDSLSATLIKLTAPGVPDIYQGNELWDFSMVDPDNRRPVDYRLRQQLLASLGKELRADELAPLLATLEDGRAKLYLIRIAVRLCAHRRHRRADRRRTAMVHALRRRCAAARRRSLGRHMARRRRARTLHQRL